MNIGIDVGQEVGQRAARILLGDARCDILTILNKQWRPSDDRVVHTTDLTGTDVLISDGTSSLATLIGRASVASTPIVVWPDVSDDQTGPATVPVIVGANVGSTLASALLLHPASVTSPGDTVQVGWTEPGTPHRKGIPMPFPEPVGMEWTKEREPGRFVARRDDKWAGATALIEGPSGQRVVGVADNGAHLEAITLVATGFVAAAGAFGSGIQRSSAALAEILDEARNLELDVAVWRSNS